MAAAVLTLDLVVPMASEPQVNARVPSKKRSTASTLLENPAVPNRPQPLAQTQRAPGGALLFVCGVALLLRLYLAFTAVAISPDSALFIDYARELNADPAAAVRHYQQHPLYPALIVLLQPV